MSRMPITASQGLTLRYTLGLALIALTCFGSQWVMQRLLEDIRSHAHVVNMAGRQRMLSQRLTKIAYQAALSPEHLSDQTLEELETSLAEFTAAGHSLSADDSEFRIIAMMGPELAKDVDSLNHGVKVLSDNGMRLASLARGKQLTRDESRMIASAMSTIEPAFLRQMDDVVAKLAAFSSARIARLGQIEAGLTLATFILLLLEAIFVFRPAVRRTAQAVAGLRQALEQARHEHQMAESAIAGKTLAISAATQDLRRLSVELDQLAGDSYNAAAKKQCARLRMLLAHLQSTVGKLNHLNDGLGDNDNRLLVSRTSPRNLVREAIQHFQSLSGDTVRIGMTMDDRLPATLLVDEQLFRDSIVYSLQSVVDNTGAAPSVHVGFDDRELKLVVDICGVSLVKEDVPTNGQSHDEANDVAVSSKANDLSRLSDATAGSADPAGDGGWWDMDSLDLLVAKRTLERIGGDVEATLNGHQVRILMPLDETRRMNLFDDRGSLQMA